MKKKKKLIIIIIIAAVVLAVLLIPHKYLYKDGGTVEYSAVLYSVTNYHALADNVDENGEIQHGYTVGKTVKILGFVVSDDTHFELDTASNYAYHNDPLPAAKPEPTQTPTPIPTYEPVTTTPPPTPDIENYYVFDSGRKLIADDLSKVDGAKALEPFYDAVFADLLGLSVEEARACLMCSNTPSAYKNLTYGNVDMIFCALPSEEQVAEAEANGVEFEYHTILSGGFVFFVNKDNPVDSITQEQLKGIVSGKITNWKEVGGEDEPIKLYQRNEGSGSQTGLYRYVLPKEEVMPPIIEQYEDSMEGVIDRVSDYDNGRGAISYSYYYYVANMYTSDEIKLLGIDGVIPSDETISKGTYPFLNFSQIVTRKDLPENSIVRDIIKYVQGEHGARIARENGYVPYLPADTDSSNSTSNIVYGSNEALAKNAELHSRLASFSECPAVGTGIEPGTEKVNEKYMTAAAYGINLCDPQYIEIIENAPGINILQVKGLKDKEVERKINDRLNEVADIFLDPAYLPDVSGIIPFFKEHGSGTRELYMRSEYHDNHIMSVSAGLYCEWKEKKTTYWKDIPDPNGDGELEYDEIWSYLYEQSQNDKYYGFIDVYYGDDLTDHPYQKRCEYNNIWRTYDEIILNFNLETGEEVRLSDMFPKGDDYLEEINRGMYEYSVKYDYWFSDYNFQNRESGYDYDPGREYDGGTVFKGAGTDIGFEIESDHSIAVFDNAGHYVYMTTAVPVYNMVSFSDIFEDEYESIPLAIKELNLNQDYLDPVYERDSFERTGGFNVKSDEEETLGVDVLFASMTDKTIRKSFFDIFTKDELTDLARVIFERSGIVLKSGDKGIMYPMYYYVYPNEYACIKWEVITTGKSRPGFDGTEYLTFYQWIKDGKDVLPADMIDSSSEELLKALFVRMGGWNDEDSEERLSKEEAEKAAEILAPHLISFRGDEYLIPVFDFQLSDMYLAWRTGGYHRDGLSSKERESLPGSVLLRVTEDYSWHYNEWYIRSLNEYYKHLKIYDGYEF